MAKIREFEVVNNLYYSKSDKYETRPVSTWGKAVKPYCSDFSNGFHEPDIWMVEPGEKYKAIRVALEGVSGWFDSTINVPVNTSDEECERLAYKLADEISEKEYTEYKRCVDHMREWGCD